MNTQKLCAFTALLFLLTAGCQATIQPAPAPTQKPLPTYTPYPTYTPFPATDTPQPPATAVPPTSTASPTQAPPTPAGQTFSYQGVTLTRPDGIGSALSAKVVPEVKGDENTPYFAMHPQYIEISIQGYTTQNKYHQPHLEVYKTADLVAISDVHKTTVNSLQDMLAKQAPLASAASQLQTETLPFLPVFNAAQILHAKGQYVAFQNGTGIRYLTQFDQAFLPVNNQEIIYTFQGLTSDGKYYVVAILPVAAPVLAPTDDYNATGSTFVPFPVGASDPQVVHKYFLDVLAKVDGQADENFAPSLALLDAMLQSVQVQ